MKENQIELFALRKPLLDRLGPELFRAAPPHPGVYLMTDENERVLYVGQSGNLRHRLLTYKNARHGRAPKKVLRLVSAVKNIAWETCKNPQEARLRENELLRLHRPKFNSMGVFPRGYFFILLRLDNSQLHLGCSQTLIAGKEAFGAFKGSTRAAFGALLRLLWGALFHSETLEQFPVGLLGEKSPKEYSFNLSPSPRIRAPETLLNHLRDFFLGRSPALLDRFFSHAQNPSSKFEQAFHSRDLEILQNFYTFGPARNQRLRDTFELEDQTIGQEELDDLLVHLGR